MPLHDDLRRPESAVDAGPIIVAVASPPGRGVRGIVRMSGDGALRALARLSRNPTGSNAEPALQTLQLGLEAGDLPAIAIRRQRPNSFTGEDTVELLVPGNPWLLALVAESLIASAERIGLPARHAQPGEFAARAFLHGRIGLPEAESIAASIAATNAHQLRAARLLAEGQIGRMADGWIGGVTELLALVEAGIDFTDEEDVVAIEPALLVERANAIVDEIDRARRVALHADRADALPTVVLAGAANAGKSTLFNALLGSRRSVVSELPGTTRDAVSAQLTIDAPDGSVDVLLIDIAGTDDVRNPLERLGQEAATSALRRADLVLHCIPTDAAEPVELPVELEDEPLAAAAIAKWCSDVTSTSVLVVRTKADLHPCPAKSVRNLPDSDDVAVSAMDGTGLQSLRRAIVGAISAGSIPLGESTLALTARHDVALEDAVACLRRAAELASGGTPPDSHGSHSATAAPPAAELIAAELRAALDGLGRVGARVTADDVLGAIFSRFCIGK